MILSKTIIFLQSEKPELCPKDEVACKTCSNAIWSYDEAIAPPPNQNKPIVEAYCKTLFQVKYSNQIAQKKLHCDSYSNPMTDPPEEQ